MTASPEINGEEPPASLTVDYAEEPERSAAVVNALLDEYDHYVDREHENCPDCPVWRSGLFVANSMLDWKSTYADGRLDHWTKGDIAEYLLEYFPRKVSAGGQLVRDTPACVRDFLYFLSDRGTFSGEDLELVAGTADRLAEDLVRANGEPGNWGMAKSFFMGAGAGVLEQPGPLPGAEQERPARGGAGGKAVAARRRKRKAARAARRRSRS